MDNKCIQKQYSKKIREALSKDQLILFIGAGVSINSGFPSWDQVIQALKKELCKDLEHVNDATKIAELYKLQFGNIELEKKIQGLFPTNAFPNAIHDLIIEINPKYIITTNQDTLLEQAKDRQGKFYDVIVNDEELVRSTLPNKIIKMHGDFAHHNIVFTEDDYINYGNNFPLIENTLKSLLCTHTVVFIGYSYNDSTLKQINSWIKIHSTSSPVMYMVTHAYDYMELEEKYLNKQNITTIIIGDKKKGDYEGALKKFLSDIVITIKSPMVMPSRDMLYDFIQEQITTLTVLNTIYYKFLINSFSNIGIKYIQENKAYLQLHITEGAFNQNMYLRKYYRQFIIFLNQLINKKNQRFQFIDPLLNQVTPVLEKTNLVGIGALIKNREIDFSLEEIKIKEPQYFSFDYEPLKNSNNTLQQQFSELYYYYNLHNYPESLGLAKEIISLARQTQQYTWAFIAMFNYNTVLKEFHYEIIREKVDHKQILNAEVPYDLDKIIESYPLQYREQVREINKFLNFEYIYSDLYQISTGLEKITEDRKKVENGYRILRNGGLEFPYKHRNTISFVLDNFILMEDYGEFKLLNQYYLTISISSQFQKEETELSNMEIYACIRYLTKDQLHNLFKEFTDSNNKRRCLVLNKDQKLWILETVWENLSRHYEINRRTKFDSYIERYLFIISIVEWPDEDLKKIIDLLSKFIQTQLCTMGFFESINIFIGLQYTLFQKLLPDNAETRLLDALLGKIINQPHNFLEYKSLTDGNTISNIFESFIEKKNKYDNIEYVEQLISMLEKQDMQEQILVATQALQSFYDIASDQVQTTIGEYWMKLIDIGLPQDHQYIKFYYTLLLYLQKRELYSLSLEQWEQLREYYINTRGKSSPMPVVYQLCIFISEADKITPNCKEILQEIIEILKRIIDRDN